MTDDTREADIGISDAPPGSEPPQSVPEADPRPAPRPTPRPTRQEFEQLKLDPTIIGPGMRTEDPYEPGTKLKIEGQRGIFRYRYATLSKAGLVSLHLTQDGVSRAVRPDQVTPVRRRGFRR